MAAEYRGRLTKLTALATEDRREWSTLYDTETQLLDTGWVPYPAMERDAEVWWQEQRSNQADYTFAIRRLQDNTFIGVCNTQINWRLGLCYIGIVVGGPYQNQGMGTDALASLVRFVYQHTGLRKIKLRVYAFNPRALHIYQKLGFAIEARFRGEIYRWGAWHDVIEMGMFADEFHDPLSPDGAAGPTAQPKSR